MQPATVLLAARSASVLSTPFFPLGTACRRSNAPTARSALASKLARESACLRRKGGAFAVLALMPPDPRSN